MNWSITSANVAFQQISIDNTHKSFASKKLLFQSNWSNVAVVEQRHALVRKLPRAYIPYYARRGCIIDGGLAISQHQQYVTAIETAGLNVDYVDSDEMFPDCVFIEDTAVLCNGHALIAISQNKDRRGEQLAVEAVVRNTHTIVHLKPEARLDGGDVMWAEGTLYVGASSRTNEAGIRDLRNFAADFGIRTVAMPVEHCLHLKTGVTYLGNDTILVAIDWFDMNYFKFSHVIFTERGEEGAANCLRINDYLLIVDGYPKTARLREFAARHGLRLISLPVTEFQKGNGSLSCMSLIW